MSYIYIIGHGIKTTPCIQGIGFTKDPQNSTFGPGQRIDYTIHYVLSGKGTFNGNPVKKNQGFLVYDGMLAMHAADKEEPWELLWITMNGENIEAIFEEYNADPNTGIFDYISPQLVSETVKEICRHKKPDMRSTRLLEIFLRLHNHCIINTEQISESKNSQSYTDWAIRYIHSNIHREITVSELTDRLGISQQYLYNLFTERFGLSPKQYIMSQKLEMAKKLLSDTDMSITEVANSVGYYDPLTFSRMFLSREKLSPQNYRYAVTGGDLRNFSRLCQ